MKIKFNNRKDTGFIYYSFHKDYKDAVLPATVDGSGYLVQFPESIAGIEAEWWYSAEVVEVVDG